MSEPASEAPDASTAARDPSTPSKSPHSDKIYDATSDLCLSAAYARMPSELLQMTFQHLFDDSQSLRTKIRLMLSIGLTCKAWLSAVEGVAVDVLPLDPRDEEAVAYFDPETGAGARLLPLVHSCCFVTIRGQRSVERSVHKEGGAAAGDESVDDSSYGDGMSSEDEDEDEDNLIEKPFKRVDNDIPIGRVDVLVSILAHMRNIQKLLTINGIERVIRKAFTGLNDPVKTWPRLVRICLLWREPIARIYPVLAELSSFTDLQSLNLWSTHKPDQQYSNDDEEDAGEAALADAAAALCVKPLLRLQDFVLTTFGGPPESLPPILDLLSPDAPLSSLTWLGPAPPALFDKLSHGDKPLPHLVLGCHSSPEAYLRATWPLLRRLGTRRILHLGIDLPTREPEDEDEPAPPLTIGDLLDDLPANVVLAETVETAARQERDSYLFDIDDLLVVMLLKPHAPMATFKTNGTCSTSFNGQERVQTVMVRILVDDGTRESRPLIFSRYGHRDDSDSLSEWHLVSSQLVDMQGQSINSLEKMIEAVARGEMAVVP
ncbi:hypothetical protein JCM10908_003642 [Rhodotorula pacifica]|uniref:uncharacterized protein n=1 Tax=Rhodotorula pacifica TaxID=1495444 RepID=UPI00316E932C